MAQQTKLNQMIKKDQYSIIKETPFFVLKPNFGKQHQYFKNGHWSQLQQTKYAVFVSFHYEKLATNSDRRYFKIFKVMSEFIKTRSSNQCRSHHQKLERQFKQIKIILEHYELNILKFKLNKFLLKYKKELVGQDKLLQLNMQEKDLSGTLSTLKCLQFDNKESKNQQNSDNIKNLEQIQNSIVYPTSCSYRQIFLKKNHKNIIETDKEQHLVKLQYYKQKTPQSWMLVGQEQNDYQKGISKINDQYISKVLKCNQCFKKWVQATIQLEELVKANTFQRTI